MNLSSPAAYGMGRMAQQLGHELPFEIEIFTDVEAARRWLEDGRQGGIGGATGAGA